MQYTTRCAGLIEVNSPRLLDELARLLEAAERTAGAPKVKCNHAAPLPGDALELLKVKGTEVPPLVKKAAWSVFGMTGFLSVHVRPDTMFPYVVVSQQVATNLTPYVFRCIVQIARYLGATRHLPLTYRRVVPTDPDNKDPQMPFVFYADSSSQNADPGSWGGYGAKLLAPPATNGSSPEACTALVVWRALTPRRLADGTVGCEGILATHALKALVGWRILMAELGLLPEGPTYLMISPQM